MGISIKRITAGLTAAVVLASGGVIASAGVASASSGSWGYKYPVGTVAHGSQTFNPVTGLWCLTAAGCDYEPGMTIIIQAANGATFSPVGATTSISPVFEPGPAGDVHRRQPPTRLLQHYRIRPCGERQRQR